MVSESERARNARRYGLFLAWNERCAWCSIPLRFSDTQIDHIIPKALAGAELSKALADHALPKDYDREATRNLVPACAKCNGPSGKGWRAPPSSPIVSGLLRTALERAPEVESYVESLTSATKLDTSLVALNELLSSDVGGEIGGNARDALELNAYLTRRWLQEHGQRERAQRARFRQWRHDAEPPYAVEVTEHVDLDRYLELIQEWFTPPRARDLLESVGDQEN